MTSIRAISVLPRAMLIIIACVFTALVTVQTTYGSSGTIAVSSAAVVSEFPEGMRFSIEVESEVEVEEIAVKFRTGTQTREVYGYMEFDEAKLVDSELFWRTNTSGRYIPPGTIIYYYFEVRDSDGNELVTDVEEFIFEDARFTWEEVSDGPVAVAYHGPVKTRAEIILEAITQTLDFMGPILGADTTVPIRVTMYNNVKEMLEALPPGSSTIRRELITEGQAFTRIGTLLVLGGGSRAKGTASHEVTHILNHRAGDAAVRGIPSWLDEGLAEFGNVDPGISYDIALEFAMATDRLLPITSMPILPGDPEDVIIFYGQARSLIQFMVFRYGPQAMRELLSTLKTGTNMEDAIQGIYGISRIELENQWRDTLGADHYVPPDRDSAKPTPIPRPSLQLFSLTPQAGSETVGSLEPTPTPEPQPAPAPEPTPTEPPAISETDSESETEGVERREGGSACFAPATPTMRLSDLALPLSVLGLIGFGLRRRRR
ncbi:MAG: hypothetical protein J4G14_10520 [Dehalococcoidia bacterium]|nr:hypothetical protein [Dehalococcoidia bacterium]